MAPEEERRPETHHVPDAHVAHHHWQAAARSSDGPARAAADEHDVRGREARMDVLARRLDVLNLGAVPQPRHAARRAADPAVAERERAEARTRELGREPSRVTLTATQNGPRMHQHEGRRDVHAIVGREQHAFERGRGRRGRDGARGARHAGARRACTGGMRLSGWLPRGVSAFVPLRF